MTLKSISRQDLAFLMGISTTTFRRKLRKHQIEVPHGKIPPDNLIRILSALGYRDLLRHLPNMMS